MSEIDNFYQVLLDKLPADYLSQWQERLKSVVNTNTPGTPTQFEPWNLDPAGKLLLPEKTPFQNDGAYAVKTGESGNNREYRAIVAQNVAKHTGAAIEATSGNSLAVSSFGRANPIDFSFLTRKKLFAKFAPESQVSYELYNQSGPFDALGKTTTASLIVAKELEERHIIHACTTLLGTPTTPVTTPSNSGGTLTNAASPYIVKVIALNYYGWWYWIPDGVPAFDQTPVSTFGLPGGAVQGESIVSAGSAGTTIAAGTTGSIFATTTPIKGAFGYLWLMNSAAGTFRVSAVSTAPYVTITALGTLVPTAPSADGTGYDTDGYPVVWDGGISQTMLDADIPGEYFSLAGNTVPGSFTSTGSGSGVLEVENILSNIWTKWGASPTHAVMSPRTLRAFSNVSIGSTAPAYRLNVDAEGSKGNIIAGTILAGIRNQFADGTIKPIREQVMPDGKIWFYTKTLPYRDANVATNLELHCGPHWIQDFFARVTDLSPMGPWAIKTYGAPVLHWPRGCGVVDDIFVS
jgi:hypothetical protein